MIKILLSLVFLNNNSPASVNSVKLSTGAKIPKLRWILEVAPPQAKLELKELKKNTLEFELAQIKIDQAKEDYKSCFQRSQKNSTKAKDIEPWIALVGLQCLTQGLEKTPALKKDLDTEIKRIHARSEWIYQGPYGPLLRQQLIDSILALVEVEIKGQRTRAWSLLDRLFTLLQYTNSDQKAKYYENLGDLTFIEQKWAAALELYKKSVGQKDSVSLQSKIEKLKVEQKLISEKKEAEEVAAPILNADLAELEKRMLNSYKTGSLGSAVEDSVEILKRFPETRSSELAGQKLIETLFLVLEENDKKYLPLREKVITSMEYCQADRLGRWAKLLYARGQYAVSYQFASLAVRKLEGLANVLDLLEIAALSADHSGNTDEAIALNKKITDKYVGTSAYREAEFRLGTDYFRQKEYSRSLSSFEAYLNSVSTSGNSNGHSRELSARYWRVRALQKLNKPEADIEAAALIEKYPVSYFGILLQAEKNKSVFTLPTAPESEIKAEYWLVGDHEKAWKRLQVLLNAGWLDEAQAELKNLPQPTNIQQKIILSKYYVAALEYPMATKWVTEAWDEDKNFRQKSLLKLVYPREFSDSIEQFAGKNSLDVDLVMSLIRQESAFSPKVVSRSGALGLMQLIPLTADEVAKDLSFKSIKIPDEVFHPKINIQMGTHYLAKMLRKYSGSVPLALASYNAGPTRLDRWLGAKGLVKELSEKNNWTPEDDLWFDELPWSETSYYVKSILRNLVVYRSLKSEQPLNLNFPVWK